MNRLQRAILIGVGLTIAVVQLYGIAENGLDENKGWAVSLLIAAALLFVGSGTSLNIFNRSTKADAPPPPAAPQPPEPARVASNNKSPARPQVGPGKYDYGVHISELDIAIEAHKNYAERCNLYVSVQGNGRSLNWNCCLSTYASMRLAALKAQTRIHSSVWNTIVRGIVIRMATQEDDGVGMGDRRFKELETAAYADIESANASVDAALAGKGEFLVKPIADLLAQSFGTRTVEGIKALSAIILINAETAHKKILPELVSDLQ